MAAPSIPNLNSLRSNRGRGGVRGRGRGSASTASGPGFSSSLSSGEGHAASRDRIIQHTDSDAAGSRLSAVTLGYLNDPYAVLFSKQQDVPRRFPVINRGTYVRTTAIDRLVNKFLDTDPEKLKQIVSLGAGTDTRFFRLLDDYEDVKFVYHEIDFASNTSEKIATIKQTPSLLSKLTSRMSEPDLLVFGSNGSTLRSDIYYIHALDLRSIQSSNLPQLPNLSSSLPTLILSECCLCYLSPPESSAILSTFTQHLIPSPTPLSLIVYEPIRPNDAFGRTMVTNLRARGIHMQTLQRYENLSAQRERLSGAGLSSLQRAADVDFLFERWVDSREKGRVARCEMFDEVEEWVLLARHYCVAWGARDEGGLFERAWGDLPGQDGD